jgi:hypothetical protein
MSGNASGRKPLRRRQRLDRGRSAEIRGLFAWACELVSVHCRADGPWNISVARRESVAILDHLVGPKQ